MCCEPSGVEHVLRNETKGRTLSESLLQQTQERTKSQVMVCVVVFSSHVLIKGLKVEVTVRYLTFKKHGT